MDECLRRDTSSWTWYNGMQCDEMDSFDKSFKEKLGFCFEISQYCFKLHFSSTNGPSEQGGQKCINFHIHSKLGSFSFP